ncbi:MAG: CD3324 family protein [Lachnospiraceae bacterium]|nr:CD3324 family protein [Lachnospiraceae bacterium]
MKYINAKDLLPDALVKELQRYIQGGYLYVPTDQTQQKRWGEVSGYRQELQQRNRKIMEEYRKGVSMDCLAEKYCLSVYAIRKIIYRK